jgi:predicted DNA-binding transcriptional regulator AlpA
MSIVGILPETGFLRLPAVLALIPVSKTTWWAWVKSGKAPRPVKLGPRMTAWKAEDIAEMIDITRKRGEA